MSSLVLIRGFPDIPKSRFSSRMLVCWIQWGRERRIEVIRYRRHLKIFENFLVFRFLGQLLAQPVCTISHFRPTNSASSRENLRPRVHLSRQLWIFETNSLYFWCRFRRFRKISQHRNISASLCLATKLIKYSKPHPRRNAFMRDFPDLAEIYPVWKLSVLPNIHSFHYRIWSYLELAIFREDFSSVASVNMLDFRKCFILFLNLLL